ncbi:TonB-dependent receptor plug domain-containing protein [Paraflavitalea speifideaquila]|uniref:TonB-dependent receptor plug domain-containing protein n=1 Tax=Paraflavitalea speifideaquila TaxID=3076558 RepID=UPI0028EBEBF0|nr:TonB-dependent receptor plug domain-containing protein [Paraflavitalea speifideiaquila]
MQTRRLLKQLLCCFLFLLALQVARAQDKIITGTISDEKNVPLAGASVSVKGAKSGVSTDAVGNFRITVPASTTALVITYVGYEQAEVAIGGKTVIDLSLQPAVKSIDAVVVVGYGTQRRKDVTGSVASVAGSQLKNLPVTNVTEALQGRAAGVEVIKNTGQPDAQPTIIIRGLSSLHQPGPLYIVDGIRVPADNINVQDIATIDILKDASATAIYGSAAAGGVIVITTKKEAAPDLPSISTRVSALPGQK